MSEELREIDVYESRRFEKALAKLSVKHLKIVDDEVERIIKNPAICDQKKGDLDYLRVHKFRIDNQLFLLGYAWLDGRVELYLLQLGVHENFYQEAKIQRRSDLKLVT